jgi:hypothetical protein
MVASRGPGGPLNLAGLAQSTTIMIFLGMFCISYVTTGMIYATSRESYQKFRNVVLMTGFGVITVQAALCIPWLSHLLFGNLIGLPPSIASPAKITLLATIPVQFLFFLRTPYLVIMYIGKATGKASLATIARIVVTAALSPLFCIMDLVGPVWAVVCLTLPAALECLLARLFAHPFLKRLKSSAATPPRAGEIFLFNLPLSIGGYLLTASAINGCIYRQGAGSRARIADLLSGSGAGQSSCICGYAHPDHRTGISTARPQRSPDVSICPDGRSGFGTAAADFYSARPD